MAREEDLLIAGQDDDGQVTVRGSHVRITPVDDDGREIQDAASVTLRGEITITAKVDR